MKEKRIPVNELATAINTNRNNVYDIFNRQTIDSGLLRSISIHLQFDFFSLYSHELVSEHPGLGAANSKINAGVKEAYEKVSLELRQCQERLQDKDLIIKLFQNKKE